MPLFSKRSGLELTPNRLTIELGAARARGADIVDLTVSNPTLAGIPYAAGVAGALARSPDVLRYEPEAFGLVSARDAVVALWRERGVETSAERVLLTASTSEAYACAFKLLCDPGDDVLVPAPSYPLLEHLGALESVRLVPYRLGFDGAWFVDLHEVERAVTARTKAVIVVSPNNPTGSYLKRHELTRLVELGLPLLSDEVFAEYPLGDDLARARSVLEAREGLVLALDGLSKVAALPQMKLAWTTLGGSAELVNEALARLELILDTFLSPGTPVQRALPELLASRHVAAGAIRERTRRNHAHLAARTRESPLTPLHVEGGWYGVVRFPSTASDEAWALRALAAGVLVQPGYFFDFDETPHVVLSLLTPEAAFDVGLERLLTVVR
jgi:aspartate/methionine/tyrosine aminotransferase